MSREDDFPLPLGEGRGEGTSKLENALPIVIAPIASGEVTDEVDLTLLPPALTPDPSPRGRGERTNRRQWLRDAARYTALGSIATLAGGLLYKQWAHAAGECPTSAADCGQCPQAAGCSLPQVWQLDPNRCIACGGCQTNCVLDLSAVKAVNCFALCGYCDICTGYFPTADYVRNTGAENQLCPTGAITRKFIEKQSGVPYFEYTIDERLCIACGKCVAGCKLMNGSLYLQVRHDRCLNCNECSIAAACPAQAFRRVPAMSPHLLSRAAQAAEEALKRKQHKKRGGI